MTKTGAALIKEKLENISHRPGVYRMLSKKGSVLYVGKAKDLKKRLTNYTHPEKLSLRIAQMVDRTNDLIVIETPGETEAFLLENDLIKQYDPYYNVLLRDDKSFPYIVLTKETFPRVIKYRKIGNRKNIKGDYFGPYASGLSVSMAVTEIQKLFGIRTCSDSYFNNRTRPCLLHQIKRCSAPCTGLITAEKYAYSVRSAKDFLNGETHAIQSEFTQLMMTYSKNMEYEKAAALRDKIIALNQIQGTEAAVPIANTDFVALYQKNDAACIAVFFYRSAKSQGNSVHFLPHLDTLDPSEIMENFLMQFYDKIPMPHEICLSHPVSDSLKDALLRRWGKKVLLSSPPFKGIRKKLLDGALSNAQHSYTQEIAAHGLQENAWEDLRKLLHRDTLEKIEVYDNSHIQGAHAVGVMIAATPQGFQKKLYRRFNIKPDETKTNDDFGMMRQVLKRRILKGLAENNLPDAMLIDGGKGQLSSVLSVCRELNIPPQSFSLLAVAKGEKHDAGEETLYSGDNPTKPIHLDLKGDLIHLIQRLRDEAHRFAIGSHRMKRAKSMFHETLKDIDDIGPKRKKALLLHFGSVRGISGASIDQLARVPGISEKIAKKIYTFYHG
ncbi:MAG: excinuclease ABC subunit UvrC [Lactobacillales bacterium]|jgi:excinuclease ABC subunit C|nr:excinuclease ABC subunit UvrC [Lactobacillales bacterium]